MNSIFNNVWKDHNSYINPDNDIKSQNMNIIPGYLGKTCILVFSYNIYQKILSEVRIDHDFKWKYLTTKLHRCISRGGSIYSLCFPSYGGTRVASILEILSSSGVEQVIGIGLGGTPQEDLFIGDVVIVEGSIRGDGVSRYYAPIEFPAFANIETSLNIAKCLTENNIKFTSGLSFGTDALYRESKSLIDTIRTLRVAIIDLESSSLLTVGRCLGLKCSWIGVVSDRLVGNKHEGSAHSEHIENNILKLIRTIISMLDKI